jgi:arylsulfatase A-like enzyme
LLGLIAFVSLVASPLSAIPTRVPAAGGAEKPSVLIILADDLRVGGFWPVQQLNDAIGGQIMSKGVEFRKGYVTNPLCCPSRASILTGNYPHTTKVWRDTPPFGGYDEFVNVEDDTIATRLQDAGYTTGLFGKYMNGYWEAADAGIVPPGWDRWMAFRKGGYYGFNLSVDGVLKNYPESQYSTTVLGDAAANFIRNTSGPTFTYFSPYAPHNPAEVEDKHKGELNDFEPVTNSAAYNERDVSDKPGYIRDRRRLSGEEKDRINDFWKRQLESMLSVDDAVANILDALRDTGRLDNTLIFFTSDNGIQRGEHRWKSKRVPYEESVHVPFFVRYDPLIQNPRLDKTHLALNIDIAPTIEDVAGIRPSGDGMSLTPLLSHAVAPWRQKFLIDHYPRKETQVPPSFCAVHTLKYVYVYYGTGEEELYNLGNDREQLNNVVTRGGYADVRAELRGALKNLCQPPPPGMHLPGS